MIWLRKGKQIRIKEGRAMEHPVNFIVWIGQQDRPANSGKKLQRIHNKYE